MGKNGHRWAHGEGSARECIKCGVKRRDDKHGHTEFQQWWGGWHSTRPPCAPADERRSIWKERERAAGVRRAVERHLEHVNELDYEIVLLKKSLREVIDLVGDEQSDGVLRAEKLLECEQCKD